MKFKKSRSLEIPLKEENFETIAQYIKEWMSQRYINNKTTMETLLLVEALFNHLIEQGV